MVIECLPQISHLLCSVFNLQDPPRRGKGSIIGQLPDDILIDILSRLPADTILRCRPVCRDWRSLTLSRYFIGVQAKRAPSVVLVQGIQLEFHNKSDYYIYDAVSKKLRNIPFNLNIYKGFYIPYVRGACGGPFLHLKSYATFWNDGANMFSRRIRCDFVFNIITQQRLGVRSGPQVFVCGFYFHKATNEYNYLCMHHVSVEERCFQYFSYNLVSRTSKKIACSRFSCRKDPDNYPVALNGALHMMTCDDCMHAVLVFEIDSRELYTLPHPEEVECVDGQVVSHKLMSLFVHGGHLGMCHARDLGVGRFDIWILEDYAKWRWVRKSMFTLQKPRFGLATMMDMLVSGCFMVSSVGKDELFIDWFSRFLFAVNVKDQSIKEIKVPHKLKSANIRRCAAYTSSLVTPHHGWLG